MRTKVLVPDSEPGEVWRYAVGFGERYAVSNYGRVHSFPKTMKPDHRKAAWQSPHRKINGKIAPCGHRRIGLRAEGNRSPTMRFIHALVMGAFVGPRPVGMQIRHLDGDPLNNRLDNLAYGTAKENSADRDLHGRTWARPVGAPREKLTADDVREIWSCALSITECVKRYGVSLFTIQSVRAHRSWRNVA
ncbi:MAG: NUMOD4 motif-containing HNH endonuclease [Gemmatimonas sp.]